MAPLAARRADALLLLAECYLVMGAKHVNTAADRYQVVVHIDQRLLASGALSSADREEGDGRPAHDCTEASRCELEDEARCLAVETARRLACDGTLVGVVDDKDGEPLSVGRRTRAISPALDRALRARDGGCRFPGCDHTRFTHGHHIKHWADGGETKLSNLVTVCSFHHRLIHEGGFGVHKADDGSFVFTRPDGRPLRAGARVTRAEVEALSQLARNAFRASARWASSRAADV